MPNDEFLPGAAAFAANMERCSSPTKSRPGSVELGASSRSSTGMSSPTRCRWRKRCQADVPVGALLTRKSIFDKIFNQMDRAVVHGSTFAKNDLAMAAGIATLEVIKSERLVEAAAKRGAELRLALTRMVPGYELMKEVRGKGLMIGVEFGPPKSLKLKASWNVLETANKGLFCQLITVPLFKDHKILTQVSGHGSHTIKLLPSLTINEEDCKWIATAFDSVIAASHKVPGAIWSLGKTLVDNAVRKSA
jgi:ornithine--oxo-acid transaminase